MCGIVGIAGTQQSVGRLVEGLRRLEYRGYDSAGLAVMRDGKLACRRAEGKISNLECALDADPCDGVIGIAHTRWATHGRATEENAHPHTSGGVTIVHNGIIENFRELREELRKAGHSFVSETDSEVIAHLIHENIRQNMSMRGAFHHALTRLRGAFAVAALYEGEPGKLYAARHGSPLVVGRTEDETFVGSDALALADWTRRIIYLDEGDWCIAEPGAMEVFDASGAPVDRPEVISSAAPGVIDKGEYRHFMEKEIQEQPDAISRTLSNYVDATKSMFALEALEQFKTPGRLIGVACGTAYFAAAISKYWFEQKARINVEVDIASEFRYREPIVSKGDLAFFVSQSGETADTLAALRYCKQQGAETLGVINVPESSIARECAHVTPTFAGPEIGVASTKAFTAQLTALACLAGGAAQVRGALSESEVCELAEALLQTPRLINQAFDAEDQIVQIAHRLSGARDVLYLGRGAFYPLAMEGALKLKEISYIHAEGYAAGELKHGPIALIEDGTPVVVIAPYDHLFEKTISNVHEVAARGAEVILLTDARGAEEAGGDLPHVVVLPDCPRFVQPIIFSAPIQLLAYHTAVLKGTDVDQPRNLAKSVTVE